jgi:hypothetical protein
MLRRERVLLRVLLRIHHGACLLLLLLLLLLLNAYVGGR